MAAFRKTYFAENRLNKDLYDMTLSEIHETLKGAKFQSSNSAKNNISMINEYVLICSEEGFSSLRNTDRTISVSNDTVKDYVYNNLKTIYTISDLEDAFSVENDLYYLMGMLHLYGIGASNFKEIQQLKVEHLIIEDGVNIVLIPSRSETNNKVSISKDLANRLTMYNNVLQDSKLRSAFVDRDTIFKPIDRKEGRSELYINKAVRNRLWTSLKDILKDDSVDSRTIRRSASSYYAYKYMIDSGEMVLTRDILKKVANRFNFAKNTSGYFYDKILDEVFIDFIQEEYGDFDIADNLKDKVKR